MDILLNIFFGIITICSFIFAVIQQYKSSKKKLVEENKVNLQLEKIKHIKYSLIANGEIINSLVQRAKNTEIDTNEILNLGRIARGQIVLILRELEKEEEFLHKWEYGKIFKSEKSVNTDDTDEATNKED